jgi:glycine cleavage system H protein
MVNDDPFGTGWMVKVKLSDTTELDGLKDAAAYRDMIGDSA